MDFISGFWKGDKSGANNKEPEQNSGVSVEEIAAKIENTNSSSQGLESPAGLPSRLEETSGQSEIESSTNDEPITIDEVSAGGKAAQLQDVSHKAYESAKYFGSFLYTVAGKAGQRVSETAKHLKHTVEENTLLGEFNKEQEAFLKSKGSASSGGGVPPWAGCADEDSLKEQILSLSADKRNFVRTPPAGVSFPFNFEEMYPTAMAVLQEDKNLEKMRFELVPKMVTEENFWRNYFYRVSLVKQSSQLSSMTQERRGSSPDTDENDSIEDSSDESVKARKAGGVEADSPIETPSHSEFVSDTYYADKGNVSADEVKRGMKQLGLQNRTGGKTLRVSVEPCDAETCSFQRLGKSNFKITFVSNQNSENATLWFKVAYQGLEVPLFNFDMDACFGKNIRCPIIEGSTLLLEHQLEMEDFFPPTRSAMTIQLDGDQGIVFCVVIPVLITN